MKTGGPKVLVIDDEPQIRNFLRIGLESQGYEVAAAADATEGLARCAEAAPALVILDLALPDREGFEVISELRGWSQVPIRVLSVRADEEQKVAALDLGANDFVTKPFGMAELLARVRALLRNRSPDDPESAVYTAGPLRVDVAAREVRLDGALVKLSRREFELLHFLVAHAGRVLTHKQLLRELWGPAHENDTQYLRVYVGQLRGKLGDDPNRPRFIATELGVGYRLLVPDKAS